MREPLVDDVVSLTRDIPHLNLHKGQFGVVRSLWTAPGRAYEVEFTGLDERTRAVLLRDYVALKEDENPQREEEMTDGGDSVCNAWG